MELLERRLLTKVARASQDWAMLEAGDRVLVAMSGGKDSFVMFHLLRALQRRTPFPFELLPVHLDQHQPGFDSGVLARWFEAEGVAHRILSVDTYSIVAAHTPPGKPACSMCSRLRRGILYSAALELGCTKIALGHHRDDAIETLLLNQLYAGQLKAMPPRLRSDDGRNVVIRPLAYCAEADIAALATHLAFPTQPCTVCSQQPDLKRARVKALIDALGDEIPHVRSSLFAALGNVRATHLFDTSLREALDLDAVRADDDTAAALGASCSS
ncbi:MAG: tRNA 2-thiocytidine(32) synthetase TtcA [Alphaproteobacteria bacterium]|nr:tRNA 2-thiocytidine(32) synthetase TtcA [Alphaproteobacteria bacterium]